MSNGTQTKRVKFERNDCAVQLQITESSLHLSCNGELHVTSDITCLHNGLLNNI